MSTKEEVLDRLKVFFEENSALDPVPDHPFLSLDYNLGIIHVFIDLRFEPGWDVDIKLRKGGNSAGSSDVVGFCGFDSHI